MSSPDLSAVLPLSGTTVTIDAKSATGTVFADQLARLTNGSPIVIQNASRKAAASTVTVTGKASLLGVSDMHVTATATVGSLATVVVVRFMLIEGTATSTSWVFSKSFPDLPAFLTGLVLSKDASGVAPPTGPGLLDRLLLADAQLVLASGAQAKDGQTGAPLQAGLNFVATCTPTALLGLLGSVIGGGPKVTLYGPIIVPKPGEVTLALQPMPLLQFPWQSSQLPPGIHLTADLGVDRTLGKALRIHNVGLRIYSPPSKAWAAANPTYTPVLAASATLEVPSAKMSLDLTALGLTSLQRLTFFGRFDGVSIGSLAQLADVAGGVDLAAQIPSDLQKPVGALSKLSLLAVTVRLGKGLSLDSVDVAVGFPGLSTTVLPSLTLNQLIADFNVTAPFGSGRQVTLTLEAGATFMGAPFDVLLELPAVVATARLSGSASIPIGTLTQAMGLPAAPPLTINDARFTMTKDGSYEIAVAMAQQPAWTIDLGPAPLTISDVTLGAVKKAGAAASGRFSGTAALAGFELAVAYQTPGDFVLRADLPDVQLLQLARALTNQILPLPSGFDVALTDGYVLIQKSGSDLVFLYATTMAGLGTVAFEARRVGAGAWGFAAGIDLHGVRISSLPGLSVLAPFEDVFHLDTILVVVASFADPSFQMPDLAAFNTPSIQAGNLKLPAQAGGVVAGLNVYAQWTIDTSSRQQDLLRKFLGLNPTLGVTLQVGKVPSDDSRLYVSYDTTIQGHPLSCRFGLQMQGGQVSIFLLGTLLASIQGQPCRFDIALLFVPNGAFISGSMAGQVSFLGVTLSNLAIVVGIDWEGIPSLGIAAEIAVDRFESSLAIFFDSADPSRSMVAGSVSDLSLKDVVDTLAGSVLPSAIDSVLPTVALVGTSAFTIDASLAAALDNRQIDAISAALAPHVAVPSASSQVLFVVSQPGQEWFLTDMTTMLHYQMVKTASGITVSLEAQIYIVPNTTSIGALRFDQGFFLNAGLKLLSFEAKAKIDVKPSSGILVDGSMDPIVIGPPALFSITSADGKTGPRISAATMSQPSATDPTLRDPHFVLDSQLTMLGLSRQLYVSLTTSGFAFDMAGSIGGGAASYDLHGHFDGPTDLSAGGAIVVQVPTVNLGPLGSINIATGAHGSFDMGVKGASVWAKFSASFVLAGVSVSLPTIDLDVNGPSLLGLAQKVVDLVVQAIKDAFADPIRWAKLVLQGFIDGVTQVAAVLRDVFGKVTADAAAAVMSAAGYAAGAVVSGLKSAYNVTADAAASVLRGAGYAAGEVGAAVRSAYALAAYQMANVLKGAGYAVSEVTSALQTAFSATANQAAAVLKVTAYAASEVMSALKNVYSVVADQAASILKGAGYAATEVGAALKSAYGVAADQAAALLKGAGYAVDQVGSALKSAYGAAVDQAASLLKGAGYAASEVGTALKSAYGASVDQAARLLKGAGYAADEVGSALKSAYGATADQAAALLRGAGYAADQVGSALKSAYGATADQAAALLKGAGYAASEVGSALKSAYGATADQAAALLKGAGYAASEVGSALKSAYGATADQAAKILKGAGYAVNEVGDALKSAYGATADVVGHALAGAGYAVDQAGNYLKDAFGLAPDALNSVLSGAGYAADQIQGFFGSLGGDFAGFFSGVGGALDPTNW